MLLEARGPQLARRCHITDFPISELWPCGKGCNGTKVDDWKYREGKCLTFHNVRVFALANC